MNEYAPFFGDAFYSDTFHSGILHGDILKKILCKTLLIKAKTDYGKDNILLAAMSEEDAMRVNNLIAECEVMYFECGHGVHIKRKRNLLRLFSILQSLVHFASNHSSLRIAY